MQAVRDEDDAGAALGRLAHALGAGGRVRALFDYRDRYLRERFGGG